MFDSSLRTAGTNDPQCITELVDAFFADRSRSITVFANGTSDRDDVWLKWHQPRQVENRNATSKGKLHAVLSCLAAKIFQFIECEMIAERRPVFDVCVDQQDGSVGFDRGVENVDDGGRGGAGVVGVSDRNPGVMTRNRRHGQTRVRCRRRRFLM